jgi:hypothetical protein
LKAEIKLIKENETYQTIATIDNWHTYFAETKKQLTQQLDQ